MPNCSLGSQKMSAQERFSQKAPRTSGVTYCRTYSALSPCSPPKCSFRCLTQKEQWSRDKRLILIRVWMTAKGWMISWAVTRWNQVILFWSQAVILSIPTFPMPCLGFICWLVAQRSAVLDYETLWPSSEERQRHVPPGSSWNTWRREMVRWLWRRT